MTDLHDLLTNDKTDSDFWIIFVEHTDGGRHYRHKSLEDAEREAERLARLNQGKGVYIFKCVGRCQSEAVIRWDFY